MTYDSRLTTNNQHTGFNLFWNHKWLLSSTAGVMLGLSFPPFPLPFLTIPAFILLFRMADLCTSVRQAMYFGYAGFLIWNIITTYWLMMATVAGGLAAILANAVLMSLPFALQFKAQKIFSNPWLIALYQAAFWISFEFLHHLWELAWTWLSLGNAWADAPALVQYISWTGYLGISFWVIFTASLLYQAIRVPDRRLGYKAAAVGLLFPLLSLIGYHTSSYTSGDAIEAVIVQPNFDSYEPYGGFNTPEEAVDLIIGLSDSLVTAQTDLVLWPENGIYPYMASVPVSSGTVNRIKGRLQTKAAEWNTTLIGGANYQEFYMEGNAPPLSRGSRTPYLIYNAALGFYPDSTIEVYRKYNLVPVVERIPYVHFLNAIDLFNLVDWKEQQGFGKGHTADAFKVGSTQTPALICYDSVFPRWIGEFVRDGAGVLAIITNDGWWGDTSGHHQHFSYARLRAVEFGRWIIRSANNGISGIIAPNGEIKVKTGYWERTAFRYEVPVIHTHTVYARFGDWFSWLIFMTAMAGMIGMIRKNNPVSSNE